MFLNLSGNANVWLNIKGETGAETYQWGNGTSIPNNADFWNTHSGSPPMPVTPDYCFTFNIKLKHVSQIDCEEYRSIVCQCK